MTTEHPTPDNIREQIGKYIAPPPGLNREQKRLFERQQRHAQKGVKTNIPDLSFYKLGSVDQLLEEEDISACTSELREYEHTQEGTKLAREWYRFYRRVGIPEPIIRSSYIRLADYDAEEGEFAGLLTKADPKKVMQYRGQIFELVAKGKKLFKQSGSKIIIDEDSRQIYRELLKNQDIPIEEIFKEILRAKQESIELIKLQIEWLKTPKVDDTSEKAIGEVEPEIYEEQAAPEIGERPTEKAFSLAGWNLFWTTTHWSQNPNHLVTIPTTTREEALAVFTEVSRGKISIKPASIFRGLEFHLQKDIIQKALATRNKYGPEGIRDWVKIKRGRDRIFLAASEAERQAVFFAAGRDDVYRDV